MKHWKIIDTYYRIIQGEPKNATKVIRCNLGCEWSFFDGIFAQGFKAAGGGSENGSYQELFRYEKILFLAKVIEFWNCENTYNYIACANFNHDFPKFFVKSLLFLQFLKYSLELGIHVLGTKTKLSMNQNLYLGLRSKNIEFWKSQICISTIFWRVDIFKIRYLRPKSKFW